MQGRFAEFWDASGVQAGDSLSFCQDPASGKVTVLRYAAMASGLVPSVAEQVRWWHSRLGRAAVGWTCSRIG